MSNCTAWQILRRQATTHSHHISRTDKCTRLYQQHRRRLASTRQGAGVTTGEERLRSELHAGLWTQSVSRREQAWGLYQKIANKGLSWTTVEQLLEVLSRDKDSTQALERIAKVLTTVTSQRELLEDEISAVQRICSNIESGQAPNTVPPSKAAATADTHIETTAALKRMLGQPSLPVPTDTIKTADTATTKSADICADASQEALDHMLRGPPISIDNRQVWRHYLAITTSGTRLKIGPAIRLVKYASTIGWIGGRRFLEQIERDIQRGAIDLPQLLTPELVQAYAKLGSFDDAERCYSAAESSDRLTWSFCLALFWSFRQKRGQELFDTQLLAHGRATPAMFGILLSEYAQMSNPKAAYALFDAFKHMGLQPTKRFLGSMARACAGDTDDARGSRRLAEAVALARSWGLALGSSFLFGLLRGYDGVQQNEIFDAVAAKADLTGYSNRSAHLCVTVMNNAAFRGNRDLVVEMARRITKVSDRSKAQAIHALCVVGEIELARSLFGADKQDFIENNATANIGLELALADPQMGPQALAEEAARLVAKGYTPTFALFNQLINELFLRGGASVALSVFERLSSCGVPASTTLLLRVIRMYLYGLNPERALPLFDKLRSNLHDSSLGSIHLHPPTIRKLVLLIVERQGFEKAQDAFEFLRTLPVDQSKLPYGTVIAFCIRHDMPDYAHSLIRHIVQRDISIEPTTVSICCRYLMSTSTVSDTINFLRYLNRTRRSLEFVTDDIFASALNLCAQTGRMVDFEWVVRTLVDSPYRNSVWSCIADKLGLDHPRALFRMVLIALEGREKRAGDTALFILESSSTSKYRALLAEIVLHVMNQNNQVPTRKHLTRAFSYILGAWLDAWQNQTNSKAPHSRVSLPRLAQVLQSNLALAINSGVSSALLVRALGALSYTKPEEYESYIQILREADSSLVNVVFYGAIANGCSRCGMMEGVTAVLDEIQRRQIKPSAKLLTMVLQCYTKLIAPATLKKDSELPLDTTEPSEEDMAEEHDDNHHLAFDDTHEQQDLQSDNQPDDMFDGAEEFSEGHFVDQAVDFHKVCLSKMLHVWEQFYYYNLTIPRSAYSIMIHACTKAHKFQDAELFIQNMTEQGIGHDDITAARWMSLHLRQGDIDQALYIFGAIGSHARCLELGSNALGLDTLTRNAEHFALLVNYYLDRENLHNAMTLLQAMHKAELVGRPWLYIRVLRCLAEADQRDMLIEVMRQMARLNAKVDDAMVEVVKSYLTKPPVEPDTDIDTDTQVDPNTN
ncbi:hypothetical protein GGI07_000487 [Coemansia sp. Benny D115]|nr:hypothetical protein GGI07_000487 [Coemansia sp. Benny D115]